jgi:hypothetical protein
MQDIKSAYLQRSSNVTKEQHVNRNFTNCMQNMQCRNDMTVGTDMLHATELHLGSIILFTEGVNSVRKSKTDQSYVYIN